MNEDNRGVPMKPIIRCYIFKVRNSTAILSFDFIIIRLGDCDDRRHDSQEGRLCFLGVEGLVVVG